MTSAEPMILGTSVPRGAHFSWKVPAFLMSILGVACTVFWSGVYGQRVAVADAPIAMPGMQSLGAQQRMLLARNGIGSKPLERMALIAIEATNRRSCGLGGRDVSAQAEIEKEAESMDAATKAEVASVVEKVVDKAAVLKMPGAGITGDYNFFDPLGFSSDIPEGKLLFYREAELKHGRVCMLATLGMFVGEEFHPLSGGNIDSFAATLGPYQSLALTQTPLKVLWFVILLFCAAGEAIGLRSLNMGAEFGTLTAGSTPGDFGFDPLGLKKGFEEKGNWEEIQTKELNNGRLAMIAAAGIIGQELATGQKIF